MKTQIIVAMALASLFGLCGCRHEIENPLPTRESIWFVNGVTPIWSPVKYTPNLKDMGMVRLIDTFGEPDVRESSRSQLMERWYELPPTLEAALKARPRAEVQEYRWKLPRKTEQGIDRLFVVTLTGQPVWGVAYSSDFYDL